MTDEQVEFRLADISKTNPLYGLVEGKPEHFDINLTSVTLHVILEIVDYPRNRPKYKKVAEILTLAGIYKKSGREYLESDIRGILERDRQDPNRQFYMGVESFLSKVLS